MRTPLLAAATCLAVTGYVHADLYVEGYRAIAVIGPAFLAQASASLAVAGLLVAAVRWPDGLPILRCAAGALAAGALAGFAASRTVGVFGFVERGLQPAPQALISVLSEVGVLLLLGVDWLSRRRAAGRVPAARASRV